MSRSSTGTCITATAPTRSSATTTPCFFVSLHQWPFYPGTGGPDDQAETTLNIPLRAGSGDAEYIRAFEDAVEPAVARFDPELVLVSAGFDAHEDDPLAEMRVTESGFRELAGRSAALAPRVAAVLEGGYELDTLPGLVQAALDGFEQRKRPLSGPFRCRMMFRHPSLAEGVCVRSKHRPAAAAPCDPRRGKRLTQHG